MWKDIFAAVGVVTVAVVCAKGIRMVSQELENWLTDALDRESPKGEA